MVINISPESYICLSVLIIMSKIGLNGSLLHLLI